MKKIKTYSTKGDRLKKKVILTVSAISLVAVVGWSVITIVKPFEENTLVNLKTMTTNQEEQVDINSENDIGAHETQGERYVDDQLLELNDTNIEVYNDIVEDEECCEDEYQDDVYWEDEYEEDAYWDDEEDWDEYYEDDSWDEYYEDDSWEDDYDEEEKDTVTDEIADDAADTIPEPPMVDALSTYEEEVEEHADELVVVNTEETMEDTSMDVTEEATTETIESTIAENLVEVENQEVANLVEEENEAEIDNVE